MHDLSGQVIKGYELREQLGVGGYGAVYRAIQPTVGREVAVKVILPQYANHPDFIRRFEAEAQLVARLEHPHIVPLYDYWREPDSAYLVMRWLRGGSLHDRLTGQPWPAQSIVPLLDQLGAALTAAHRHGVVHRDLKPANILLDEDGNIYLADFGIAKDLGSAFQTDHSGVIGSPAYISPEQIKAGSISPRTDIYSLGIMLYELLTGDLPFEGPTPIVVLFKHIHEQLPRLQARRPELGEALNAVIQRATAKHPEDRYPDVMSLVAEFRQAIGGAPLERSLGGIAPAGPARPAGNGHTTTGRRRSGSIYDTGVLYHTALMDAVVPAIENPYKGLRAFQEADASDFFGREALTRRLLGRLSEPGELARFLAVIGPSGSGKSSVVRAGVIPALRRGTLSGSRHWFIVEMIPGAQPMAELASALLRVAIDQPPDLLEQLQRDELGLLHAVQRLLPGGAETELVLVIDQFEEVFTLVEDEPARAHFLNSLLAAVTNPHSRLRVVITLRADFYDRPLLYTGLSEVVRQRTEVVTPLTPEELQHAIVGPAERVGVALEADLVGAILHDVGEQPGTLPLLQYALTELFDRRTGRLMTLDAYQHSGGVLGALARSADEIYARLKPHEQEAARQLFLRLVTLGEGMEDTRRRVLRSELTALANDQGRTTNDGNGFSPSSSVLGASSPMDTAIDAYGKHRLLTFDRDPVTRTPTVEVAHEALIRTWGRLRDWLDQSRDDLRLQRRLAAAAAEWANAGRDRSYLASGVRLEQFAEWAGQTQLALNADERAYLQASLAERDAQLAQEQARIAREVNLERRSRNVLRALVGVFVAATVVGLGLAALAFSQRQAALAAQQEALRNAGRADAAMEDAQREARNAQDQKAIAEKNAAQAQFLAVSNGAQVALGQGNNDEALMLATIANGLPQHTVQSEQILSAAAYPPGTRHLFADNGGPVQWLEFSRDGSAFLAASAANDFALWDAQTYERRQTFTGHAGQVQTVAFSPDGRRVVSGSEDKHILLWDAATGKQLLRFTDVYTGDVKTVLFTPDGKSVLSSGDHGLVILWDTASGREIRRFAGHTQKVRGAAISPDGKLALTGAADQEMILWDVASGAIVRRFEHAHTREIYSVAFSPDGTKALSGAADNLMILWDVATGKPLRTFKGHSREVWVVRFSPDGRTALSGALDNKAGLWSVESGELIRFLTGHGAQVRAAAFSPTSPVLLTGSSDGTARLWDLDNGAQVGRLGGHTESIRTVAFSPDGKLLLSGAEDSTTQLWNVSDRTAARPPVALHEDAVRSVAFSPDGKTALSSSGDTTIVLEEIPSGRFLRVFKGHTGTVNSVAFSPDGKTAISGAGGGDDFGPDKAEYVILWDVATGQKIRAFKGHKDSATAVAFLPDGQRAISASSDKTLILWNLADGEPLRTFKGHESRIRSLAVSPDGKLAISGDELRTIMVWDLETGEPLRKLQEHNGGVLALAFSPDGKTFASGSDDRTAMLWDVATGQPTRRYSGHDSGVTALAFSPDGRTLATASPDLSIRLWRIDKLDELLAWTKANRYIPTLTCDKQQIYQLTNQTCVESSELAKN